MMKQLLAYSINDILPSLIECHGLYIGTYQRDHQDSHIQ